MKQGWGHKMLMFTLTFTLIVPLLAACTKQEEVVPPGQERILRIGFQSGFANDATIRQQYVDTFEMANPNVRIELVPTINYDDQRYEEYDPKKKMPSAKEAWSKLLEGANAVDVVITDTNSFGQMAKDGKLAKLDERMVQDKFETSDLVPVVYDAIKDMGNGSIYGLSPTFSSGVLLYNKKLFQDAGVEFPKDGMTWDEVFTLAERVSKGEGKDRKYGLAFNPYNGDIFTDINNAYINPLQLQVFDSKAEKMLVNSDKWSQVWERTAKLYKDKIVPGQEAWNMENPQQNEGPFAYDLFLSGRLAMTTTELHYMHNDLISAMKNAGKIKNFKPFEWDVVSMPFHAEAPNVTGLVKINDIFAINAKAPNAEDAWDFIRYVNGDTWAKVRSRGTSYDMVTRKSHIKPAAGSNYNVSAFFSGKFIIPPNQKLIELYTSKQDLYRVDYLGSQMFNEVITGKKSTQNALAEWETKGNEMLQKIKNGVSFEEEEKYGEGPGH
ncbi:extracellular solute-binding protein [Paenibacillus sp. SC116]|uniref:ABC transporter substrate-binding protein n=1 Tax=Paenibacillus sp. SC116 TaxID=2968986 RepID=UPI00215A5E17|nr:extracellular solute-binding protein [Paenibacillus sp. SC116]MCR8842709.1 extracellular solute-binding protein [Paenibacillus sp. SC116]